jgi:hypothetical protein
MSRLYYAVTDIEIRTSPGWMGIVMVFATLALVCAMGSWFLYRPWMGIKVNDGNVIQVGRYRSLDKCRKGCSDMGSQLVRQGLQEVQEELNR